MKTNVAIPNIRDNYWDTLKFVLIFLVVFGHVLEVNYPPGSVNRGIYNFIYSFHMPLFVFISGRFSHIKNRANYKKGIIRLLETYVAFQVIRTILTPPRLYGYNLVINALIIPNFVLWYLVALVYWRLIVLYAPQKIMENRMLVIIGSLLISLFAGFIPIGKEFAIQRTLSFMPFFFCGYYLSEVDIRKTIKKIPFAVAIVFLLLIFLLCVIVVNDNISYITSCTFPYWDDDISYTMMCFFARIIFLISAIFISLLVLRVTPEIGKLAKWGQATLFIFVYHSFLVKILPDLTDSGMIPRNIVFLIEYSIIIVGCLICLSRIQLLNIMLNPITSLRGKVEKMNHQ